MSDESEYTHHSLNIHPTEKAAAEEVSAELSIEIEFKAPRSLGPESPGEGMVGVYCKTWRDAAWFEHAFEQRRWEDGKRPGGE